MSGGFRVTIDRDDCISCGACWTACPEFFEVNPEDGFSQVLEEYQIGGDHGQGEAPVGLRDCVMDGVDSCPVEIIHAEGI